MKSKVVPFPVKKVEPTLDELVKRVRVLAADTGNMRLAAR